MKKETLEKIVKKCLAYLLQDKGELFVSELLHSLDLSEEEFQYLGVRSDLMEIIRDTMYY